MESVLDDTRVGLVALQLRYSLSIILNAWRIEKELIEDEEENAVAG